MSRREVDLATTDVHLAALVHSLDAVVWEADAATRRFEFVSEGAVTLLGYPVERWHDDADFWTTVVHPGDLPWASACWRTAAESGEPQTFEFRALHADGRTVWLRNSVVAAVDDDGRPARLRGLMVDVTDQKLGERRQHAQHEVTRMLAEAATLAEAMPGVLETLCDCLDWAIGTLWAADLSSDAMRRVQSWISPALDGADFDAATRLLTLRRGEGLPGRVWATGTPAWVSDVAADPEFIRGAAAGAAGLHGAFAFPVAVAGEVVAVLEFFSAVVREPDEEVHRMMATVGTQIGQFIERTRRDEEVRFQSALLRSQSEATPDGILVVSAVGAVLSVNRRLLELFDLGEEIVGTEFTPQTAEWLLDRVADPARVVGIMAWLRDDEDREWRGELELDDGRTIDCFSAPLASESGLGYGRAWYFRDITGRKRVERALREGRQRFSSLARTLQQSLLPPSLPAIPGLSLAATYRPAGEGLEVGGDFYDVFPTGRRAWGFVMGDVCGKGAEAASLTALARYSVRTAALAARKPSRILGTLNEAVLREEGDERYCTVTFVRLRTLSDGAEVTVASGGHPLPMVLRADGGAVEVGRWGTAIGLFPDTSLSDTTTALHPGDTLLLYTDGVVEARRGDELFGTERLARTLEEIGPVSADALVRRVEEAVIEFSDGDLRDDLALLAVQVSR